jgi:hypothetical protein
MTAIRTSRNGFADLISDLYARWTFDCLIDIGYAISLDFIARPQLYQDEAIPDEILKLRMSYGTSAGFPNTVQRQMMISPILGISDSRKPGTNSVPSSFEICRRTLVDACVAFSERSVDTGVSMLEQRVRSALLSLRSYFDALQGKSVQLSYLETKALSDVVFKIMSSAGVAKVFSVSPPAAGWPLISSDPNGAKVVESASNTLQLPREYSFSYAQFIQLQRVAQEGQRALALVLAVERGGESDLRQLISQVYSWGTSLMEFQGSLA